MESWSANTQSGVHPEFELRRLLGNPMQISRVLSLHSCPFSSTMSHKFFSSIALILIWLHFRDAVVSVWDTLPCAMIQNVNQAESQEAGSAHLICLSSLMNQGPALSVVQNVERVILYILSGL